MLALNWTQFLNKAASNKKLLLTFVAKFAETTYIELIHTKAKF